MADASLKIDIDVTGERQLNQLQRDMVKTGLIATGMNSRLSNVGKTTSKLEQAASSGAVKWKRYFGELDKIIVGTGKAIQKGLTTAVKLFTAEIGLMSIAIVGMHGILALGPRLMKAWTGAVNVAAAAAAAFGAAMAVAAAAVREQQVAMFAFKGSTSDMKNVKSNMGAVRATMRGMETDALLASTGMQNLSAAFAEISQNAKGYTVRSQALLKGLLNFASAGQPLDKGLKSAASLVKVLEDPKGNMTQVKQAVEALGPQAKKAFDAAKKSGIDTMAELRAAITSGQFSVLGGVEGQFDAVNDTLLSRGKRIFSVLKSQFADVGDTFLPDVKVALEQMGRIFTQLMFRIRGGLQQFGKGNFLESLVSLAEKLSHVLTNLFNENLSDTEGMIGRIKQRWNTFTYAMEQAADYMRLFVDAAKVLEKTFGNIFRPLKNYIGDSFGQLNTLILSNEQSFLEFGSSIGEVLASIGKFGSLMKEIFVDAMPFITKVLDGVKVFVDALTNSLDLLRQVFKSIPGMSNEQAAFQTLMTVRNVGRGLAGYKGGVIPAGMSTQNMNVNAGVVNLSYGTGVPGRGGVPIPAGVSIPGGGTPSKAGAAGAGMMGGVSSAIHGKSTSKFLGGGGGMASRSAQLQNANAQFIYSGGTYIPPGYKLNADGTGLVKGRMPFREYMLAPAVTGVQAPRGFGKAKSLLARSQASRGGQAMARFNQGTGARMATSMGMGAISSFMAPEAQGSMALGGMVANFNPLLGAAVGFGGAALNARTTLGGIGTGAASGAALGALAGPGGAIAGALIGGALGGFASVFNRRKNRLKEVRAMADEIASGITNTFISGITDIKKRFGATGVTRERVMNLAKKMPGTDQTLSEINNMIRFGGGLPVASGPYMNTTGGPVRKKPTKQDQEKIINYLFRNQKQLGFNITQEELDTALKGGDERKALLKRLGQDLEPRLAAMDVVTKTYSTNIEKFMGMTGKTEQEILALAEATGVNLFDATQNAKDMFNQLAQGMIHDMQSLQAAAAEFGAAAMGKFDLAIKQAAAGPAINETTEVLRQRILSGEKVPTADILSYLQTSMGQFVDLEGGDYMAGLSRFASVLGGPQGRAFTTPGNQLTGMQGEIFADPRVRAVMQTFLGDFTKFRQQSLSELLSAGLGGSGFQLAAGGKALNANQMLGLGGNITEPERKGLEKLFEDLKTQNLSSDEIQKRLQGISDKFKDFTLMPLETSTKLLDDASKRFDTDVTTFRQAVLLLITQLGGGPSAVPGADTKTPKSAYGDTLAKHNAINSSIPGSRMITSGIRNFNLGSTNSDHLTGNAIDLVGSNLVSYQTAMRGAGGFAEFHGAGPNRHLHAVPNAMGDTSSPMGGGGGSYNYNITINGSGMNPQQVANEVARIIERTHRNKAERS